MEKGAFWLFNLYSLAGRKVATEKGAGDNHQSKQPVPSAMAELGIKGRNRDFSQSGVGVTTLVCGPGCPEETSDNKM